MRKLKGFTLVELLVVISIIALLLAVLIPSLNKARQVAQRVICSNHLKTFTLANATYAAESNGRYVPIRSQNSNWPANRLFRKLLDLDNYLKKEDKKFDGTTLSYDLPNAYLCPADKIGNNTLNRYTKYTGAGAPNVLLSYGANLTDWMPWRDSWGDNPDAGHTMARVKQPAAKLAFIDTVDWWVWWGGADYENAWDILGQATIYDYKKDQPIKNPKASLLPARVDGPIIYRHNEGANIGFYDGHSKWMKKQEIFVKEDRALISTNPPIRKNPGMWVSDMDTYIKNRSQ